MVGFPLLLIPLAIYNIIVFLMPSVSFTDPLVKLTLMSGAEWPVTLSDVLLALGVLLLLLEVIKGARPGAKYLTDHLLSLIVFGAAAAEFVMWPKFGTSTYFLLVAAVDGRFPLRHRAAHAARHRCGSRTCGLQASARAKAEAPADRARNSIRVPATAHPAPQRGLGRRIRGAGSSRAETCPSRPCGLAGSPVAGIAAGQRRVRRPRRRSAERRSGNQMTGCQMTCRVRKPVLLRGLRLAP